MPSAQAAQLAADLAPYLLPLLPLLEKTGKMAGGAAAKALGTQLGEGIPAALKKLWQRLASRLEERPEAVDGLRTAANSASRDAVQAKIATLLGSDESFRQEVAGLLDRVISEGIVMSHVEIGVHGGDLHVVDLQDPEVLKQGEIRRMIATGRIGETLPGSTAVGLRIRRAGASPGRQQGDDDE